MKKSIMHPTSGEALFGAFVQPCLDERLRVSTHRVQTGEQDPFTQEQYDLYVRLGQQGLAPTREMLKRDFPTPVSDLVRFARRIGVTDEEKIWSHAVVAKFWRTEHEKNDPECKVKRSWVLSLGYPQDIILAHVDHEGQQLVVNLLHLPLHIGDMISVHKFVVCEICED